MNKLSLPVLKNENGIIANPMAVKKKTGVIYARFSSSSQREESIEDQIRVCTEYANSHGIEIISTYEDRAKSGTNDQRPGFQTMIYDSRKRAFDMVIVYKIDRFSRNQYDHAIYQEQLKRNGVAVVSATENLTDDVNGNLMRAIMQAMSENYSRQLSENIKRGNHGNAMKCKANGGTPPFGYRVNKETKKYELDPATAPIVQEVFSRAVNGETVRSIRQWLESLGYKFTYNGMYKMFKNERYIGYYIYGDVRIKDGMPQIIDNDTFERASALCEARQHNHCKNPDDYLLSGKLTCGVCGRRINGEYATGKNGKRHNYYCCKGYKNHTCNLQRIKAEDLEDDVIKAICKLIATPDMVKQLTDAIMEAQELDSDAVIVSNYEKQLKDVRKRKSNILKAIEEGAYNDMIAKRLAELDASEASLVQQIQKAKLQATCLDRKEIESYLNQISEYVKEDKVLEKDLVDILITEIIITEKDVNCVYDLRNEKSDEEDKKIVLDPSKVEGVRVHELWWSKVLNIRIYSIPHKIIFSFKKEA